MKPYKQLTINQRYQIYFLSKENKSLSKISKEIGCYKSTISRELKRNKNIEKYDPIIAQNKCNERKKIKKYPKKINETLKEKIINFFKEYWSPEQISGYLKKNENISISHETIYKFLYNEVKKDNFLKEYFRRTKKKRKNRLSSKERRGLSKNRKSINERPKIVEEKSRIGDWEIDTMLGKNHKGVLITMVERKSKYLITEYSENKTAKSISEKIIKSLSPYIGLIHTITFDNGKEFAFHEEISKFLKTNIYFANPYSSWERGLNENTNGLIRQIFPKKSIFDSNINLKIKLFIEKLNSRPRKTLNFDSPKNIFYNELKMLNIMN